MLLADAAERAGIARYLLVSSMGVEGVADGAAPDGVDEVFAAYLWAKLAAEREVLARTSLRTTVLRPGGLTDDPGTGRVTLNRRVERAASPGTTWRRPCWPSWTSSRTADSWRRSAARPRFPRRWPRSANYGGRG